MASENVSVSGLTGRYATALFELAQESKSLDAVAADLTRVNALLIGSADLARLVRSPVFSREEQGRAMDAVLDGSASDQLTKNFVGLLAQKRRLFALARHHRRVRNAGRQSARRNVGRSDERASR